MGIYINNEGTGSRNTHFDDLLIENCRIVKTDRNGIVLKSDKDGTVLNRNVVIRTLKNLRVVSRPLGTFILYIHRISALILKLHCLKATLAVISPPCVVRVNNNSYMEC